MYLFIHLFTYLFTFFEGGHKQYKKRKFLEFRKKYMYRVRGLYKVCVQM